MTFLGKKPQVSLRKIMSTKYGSRIGYKEHFSWKQFLWHDHSQITWLCGNKNKAFSAKIVHRKILHQWIVPAERTKYYKKPRTLRLNIATKGTFEHKLNGSGAFLFWAYIVFNRIPTKLHEEEKYILFCNALQRQ